MKKSDTKKTDKKLAEADNKPQEAENKPQEAENKPQENIVEVPIADNGRRIAIKITDLHKSYGEKQVLKGLNIEVYEGELFGFIGRNGIGKSTTIDCIIGSKKFNSGSILVEGHDIVLDPIGAKKTFGYVASEPACYDVMRGIDYLEFVASIYHMSEGDFLRNTKYLAGRLALDERELHNRISNYSHGMKQKLCLIASLMHNPNIWILDEPTVGLDIMAVEALKKMMREYADHGKAVFVTSHNIELVSRLCDRVAIINNGTVVALYDLNKEPNRRLQLPKIFVSIYGE